MIFMLISILEFSAFVRLSAAVLLTLRISTVTTSFIPGLKITSVIIILAIIIIILIMTMILKITSVILYMIIPIILLIVISLENDPNMRLQQCGNDLMPSIEFGKQLFQSGDDGEMIMMTMMMRMIQ